MFAYAMKHEKNKEEYYTLIEDISSALEASNIINISVNQGVPFLRFTVDSEEMQSYPDLKNRLQCLWDSYIEFVGKQNDSTRKFLRKLNYLLINNPHFLIYKGSECSI